MNTLITGFGPFDGGSNASEALVRALDGRGRGATLILPVDTARAGDLLDEAVARVKPTHLLMTGQAAGRNRVSLERLAMNRRDFRVPDASGIAVSGATIVEAGPEQLVANWPDLKGCVAAMNAGGIPAQVSEDCGTHLCNQVLYLALHAAQEARWKVSATFLHVPLLPEQVIAGEPAALRTANCPYMPLDMTIRAVETVLAHTAALELAA